LLSFEKRIAIGQNLSNKTLTPWRVRAPEIAEEKLCDGNVRANSPATPFLVPGDFQEFSHAPTRILGGNQWVNADLPPAGV